MDDPKGKSKIVIRKIDFLTYPAFQNVTFTDFPSIKIIKLNESIHNLLIFIPVALSSVITKLKSFSINDR